LGNRIRKQKPASFTLSGFYIFTPYPRKATKSNEKHLSSGLCGGLV